MGLTEKQRNNIYHLNFNTQLEIMHECAEALGLVDIKTCEKIRGLSRRTIYDKIKKNKLKTFNIGIHKFPCINTE